MLCIIIITIQVEASKAEEVNTSDSSHVVHMETEKPANISAPASALPTAKRPEAPSKDNKETPSKVKVASEHSVTPSSKQIEPQRKSQQVVTQEIKKEKQQQKKDRQQPKKESQQQPITVEIKQEKKQEVVCLIYVLTGWKIFYSRLSGTCKDKFS